MARFRQLKPQDVMFIGGETPNVYQHTAGLTIIDASDCPDFSFEKFRKFNAERIGRIPLYRWCLHEVPMGLDLPYWVEDKNFNIDHHVRRIAVPSPGDRQALAELASYLYCRHMDRSRPLWEMWFIEGLPKGQYALFFKQHHCMIDGEGAAKLGDFMFDHAPDAAPRELPPEIANARPGSVPEFWRQSLIATRHLYGLPARVGRELLDAVLSTVRSRFNSDNEPRIKTTAPATFINTDIGKSRGLVFGSFPLADIIAVKNHFGVTFNDAVLALVSGSLRDYMLARDALPEESMRTHIPVSLRTDNDDVFSNRVTSKSVTLATALEDPVARLRAIAEETEIAKREAHAGSRGMMEIVQIFPPVLFGALINMAPADQVAQMMGANVVVSSVRGTPEPMYICGARVAGSYPMSVITPGGAINITCVSLAGAFEVGITIEPEIVPEPWMLIDGLHKALDEYMGLVGGRKAGRSQKRPVRAKAGARPKRAAPKKRTAPKKRATPKRKDRPE